MMVGSQADIHHRPVVAPHLLALFLGMVIGGASLADTNEVVRWEFGVGSAEERRLQSHGSVQRNVPGPRPPSYPDFAADNTAVKLDGTGARLVLSDSGTQSPFDFSNTDEISLEAWVQVNRIRPGEYVYIIGKGRTGSPGFMPDNQNWALRLRGLKKDTHDRAAISFLFASVPGKKADGEASSRWHRWTSRSSFAVGPSWHHIAIAYRFGEPESVRGWIDGKKVEGAWDLGGKTTREPVTDDDEIWIGSSRRAAPANSLDGALDEIAIHRGLLSDQKVSERFRLVGKEPAVQPAPERMPEIGSLAIGESRMTFHEGMPAHDRWLNDNESLPAEVLRWSTEQFLLDRLPQRFDAWGIRADWKAPVLVRFVTTVNMPAGTHRFVMRVRGLSRLWVDGQLIARCRPAMGSPSGEEPITPLADPPLPGLRRAEHRQQEVFGEYVSQQSKTVPVVLETIVGGKTFRTDPGETLVAVRLEGQATYVLLRANGLVDQPDATPLTDKAVSGALMRLQENLQAFDDQRRWQAAASQDAYWATRHAMARKWVEQRAKKSLAAAANNQHPIDAFVERKIRLARHAAAKTPIAEARQFHSTVLPLLRDNCFRCHGQKKNGGLRLDSRKAALRGGDSEVAAVAPREPEASEMIRRLLTDDPDERMPPGEARLASADIELLRDWIARGADWPAPPVNEADILQSPLVGDAQFLRRVYLDTVGVPPDEQAVRSFLADSSTDKRTAMIDRLLDDQRTADQQISYWQDILAENPTLINASLNTTGPFRWFLHDALRDNKPLDRLVTELILMRGSRHEGGSAGFGIAANNDAPMAAKGQILASAFLGIELQCARCHDSPYHSTTQHDLYSLAAMLERKPLKVPESSRVPESFFENHTRESLIKVTLKPDEIVSPSWPFRDLLAGVGVETLSVPLQDGSDSRHQLAALITSPQNTRFAQVWVNRVWRRLLGGGLVEPPDDWEGNEPSHPELLDWLAKQLVVHDYDTRWLMRLIMTSDAYQREPVGQNRASIPPLRFFAAPDRRRLSAEQVVDSLYASSGQSMNLEELTFDPDARRPASNRLTLGRPQRAWMLASLANERDRPSLGLPRARAVTDIMKAFGWTGSRQNPRTDREMSANVLQPGVLANSVASVQLTRVASGSDLADVAVRAQSPDDLLDSIFLRYLTRLPTNRERDVLRDALAVGFDTRLVTTDDHLPPDALPPLPRVTWSNHLRPESTTIALELERRARTGPCPDPRLEPAWREVLEDVIWSVVNLGEFVWIP